MCGIVGYIGDKQAAPLLLDGLKKLEYRGYDSAGVAMVGKDGALNVYKCKGKVSDLEHFLEGKELGGSIGIAHTRWATHGKPDEINAHPHVSRDGKWAVVHNGIIENYLELREFLQQKGVKFASQTDTEVVAQLMEYCIADAKARGKSGVCMLGADKQKAWLSDQKFAQKYGFTCVDRTADGYQLLALSLDGSVPRFAENAKSQRIDEQELTVYYDDQCPFIPQRVDKLRAYCEAHGIPARFIHVDTLAQAKALPCVFNNWAVLYQGRFVTVNQLDGTALEKLLRA